jgi:uncharacterized protein (DUF1501 family)
MKRRDFLAAASSMVLPVALDGFGLKTFDRNSALVRALAENEAAYSDRILVMIYLNGGNDGLNTVIPIEHYSSYHKLRTNLAIPENKLLRLDGSPETGFHPAMTGMQQLYNEGKLAIINAVSYPNASLSHVRSTDIMMTGTDADKYATSGWAGRYLDDRFPGYPEQYPNDSMKDPLAIQIGYINSTSLLGSKQSMGISLVSPDDFYELVGQESHITTSNLPCCDAGQLIKSIRQQQILAIEYSSEIKRAAGVGRNMVPYPVEDNDLAKQLQIVARLIHGGLQTKIYYVEMGGFDTHAGQVDNSSTLTGVHSSLLKNLSGAIAAFQKDLQAQKAEDRVIGMTFSEFGRRATSNASKGTDHGIGAPMFVFGTGIKRRVIGTNPHLVDDLVPLTATPQNNNQDIAMQVDFRRVYSDILKDWFGANQSKTDTLLFKNFKTTSIFSDVAETLKSGNWEDRSVWSIGRMPSPTDYVKVNAGHIIKVGQDIFAKNIDVSSGGELQFSGNYRVLISN